jgi:hypothetical protein
LADPSNTVAQKIGPTNFIGECLRMAPTTAWQFQPRLKGAISRRLSRRVSAQRSGIGREAKQQFAIRDQIELLSRSGDGSTALVGFRLRRDNCGWGAKDHTLDRLGIEAQNGPAPGIDVGAALLAVVIASHSDISGRATLTKVVGVAISRGETVGLVSVGCGD